MQKFARKIRRLERKYGARATNDPEGVMATLQVAQRLVKESAITPVDALNQAADEFAAPKDPARAFWAAYHALNTAAYRHGTDEMFPKAIEAQGKVNLAVKKGPK